MTDSYDRFLEPERTHACPSSDCRGQFFWLRGYGMLCTIQLADMDPELIRRLEVAWRTGREKSLGVGLLPSSGMGL